MFNKKKRNVCCLIRKWRVSLPFFLSNKFFPLLSLFVPPSLSPFSSAASHFRRRRLKVRYSILKYLLQFSLIMGYLILTVKYSIGKFSRCSENWLQWNMTQDELRIGSENFRTTSKWWVWEKSIWEKRNRFERETRKSDRQRWRRQKVERGKRDGGADKDGRGRNLLEMKRDTHVPFFFY